MWFKEKVYFVSFRHGNGYGNGEIAISPMKKIRSIEDIETLARYIEEKYNMKKVSIMYFRRIR